MLDYAYTDLVAAAIWPESKLDQQGVRWGARVQYMRMNFASLWLAHIFELCMGSTTPALSFSLVY